MSSSMLSFTSWKSCMVPWKSLLSTSWYALGIKKERPHLKGQEGTKPWQQAHKLTQAFKVHGNVSHLFSLLHYFKHDCKDDPLEVLLAVPDHYWVAMATTVKGEWYIREKLLPMLSSSTLQKVAQRDCGICITGRAMANLIYSWPCSKHKVDFWMPLSTNKCDFFLSCQKPLCLAISHSNPAWHTCILTSKGS